MDRIQKALELARGERERHLAAATPATLPEAVNEPLHVQDTLVFQHTRVADVDAMHLRAQRILPPDLTGPMGRGFRMLRTQVLQRLQQRDWNLLAVMSPAASEGKTFTAINLAIAIASDTHHTTLLVDFDLRNPSVHQRFGITPDVGVEQCLRGEAEITDALVNPKGYGKLVLLPAREAVGNSSELLASARTKQLIQEIKARYPNRIVIFDLPPVLGADDALAFAPQVDAALLVVGEARTRREELVRCFEILRDVPIVGTVLNGSRSDDSLAYAY